MAGHSKWKQIKRKKAVTDNRRASAWTKLIREITVAAKAGGGDLDGNPRLRLAVDTAKAANMPNVNIDRAIKKGTGELEGETIVELAYEGYGPAGVAIYIEATSDNPTRTVADVRYVFSRNGGTLGAAHSVAWMFDRKGQITFDAAKITSEDQALDAALEAGAEDFAREGDLYIVSTAPFDLHPVMTALKAKGYESDSAEVAMVPKNTVKIEGKDAQQLIKLIDGLEELDDVAKVFSNFEMDADAMVEADA
jgi:YebC/PmpR family DNA-binding regulatory protein